MIQEKLYNLDSFKKQYESVLQLSVSDTIPGLIWKISREELLQNIDWNNMLSIASILAYGNDSKYLDASLRISQTCISTSETNETQKSAAAAVLGMLTNNRAIQLGIKKQYLSSEYFSELPLSIQINKTYLDIENSIVIKDKIINLNRFQRNVYEKITENNIVSISAPTSAGKSFILCRILLDTIEKSTSPVIIAYIVPTRALIEQVEHDLVELLEEYGMNLKVNISTVPQVEELTGSNIFIFTQERLHWLLSENQDLKIDFLFVDEAQKINDGNRGILLQQKIEEVAILNPKIKIYFSSPFTSNPEILFDNLDIAGEKVCVDTQFVAVNQNLLYISQVPKIIKRFQVDLCLESGITSLGYIDIKDRPGTSEYKKIALLAEAFDTGNGAKLIYCNGAADAEEIALILYNTLPNISDTTGDIRDLIALIKKTIHKDYCLVKTLEKGIAFHYGNMPLIIREEIERLFRNGDIKYLLCTSTLLEGVNLPAKSIFIRKPTRGLGKPLNENDFWNLAGRAGRLGEEFSGNIICIDPNKWELPPNPNKTKQKIYKALDIVKESKSELLFNYIKNGSPREESIKNQDLEFAFGYFYSRYLDNSLLQNKNDQFIVKLVELFDELKTKILIPDNVIKRNPGISPIAQQELYNYFLGKIEGCMTQDEKRIKIFNEGLIPVYPEDENSYTEYIHLISRIGKSISKYPKQLSAHRSILVINWMKGRSIAYIINESIKSYKKREEKGKEGKKLATIIREVMNEIESFVRFEFAKDSICYIDILRFFLEENNLSDLKNDIPELNLWLEFGVNEKSHLSLLSLGLSRNSVIELSEYIPRSDMNRDGVLSWLKELDLSMLNLSPIIQKDILRVLKN